MLEEFCWEGIRAWGCAIGERRQRIQYQGEHLVKRGWGGRGRGSSESGRGGGRGGGIGRVKVGGEIGMPLLGINRSCLSAGLFLEELKSFGVLLD